MSSGFRTGTQKWSKFMVFETGIPAKLYIQCYRDYSTQWMTACEIINSEMFLGAENNYNLFCCRKDLTAETEEERMRLQVSNPIDNLSIIFDLASWSILFGRDGECIQVTISFYRKRQISYAYSRRGTIVSNPDDGNRQPLFTNPILYGINLSN